ncbi:MAG: flavodoxin family protein [Firmicutes bacterium]|nr:flavodoxin family protein [Bacillota bacterium]
MKVVAFNGSPRPHGNTAQALETVLAELRKAGIETELVQLGGRRLYGCLACGRCRANRDMRCAGRDDEMNERIAKAFAADGILIGSPTYFSNVTAEVKAFIDRCGYVAGANGNPLKGKVGAAVVAARRAGSNFTYAAINFFFGINEMIVPGSSYWNMTLARDPDDYIKDEEGVRTFRRLGENMAALMKRLG